MQRFPEKLRTLRERHSMSQQKLASSLEVGRTFVQKLEAGERKPHVEMLLKIAQLFGVSMDQLARDDLEV
jgi:transcriptional regulator with XRE-family HTH domain